MRSCLTLLLACIAGASALLASPRVPLQQQQIASRVAASPCMGNDIVRVEIELENGEPCVPRPPTWPERVARACEGLLPHLYA